MSFDLWQDTVQLVMDGAKGGFSAIWQLLDRLGAFIETFIFLFLIYTVFRLMIAPLIGSVVNITRSDYALKIVDRDLWDKKHRTWRKGG